MTSRLLGIEYPDVSKEQLFFLLNKKLSEFTHHGNTIRHVRINLIKGKSNVQNTNHSPKFLSKISSGYKMIEEAEQLWWDLRAINKYIRQIVSALFILQKVRIQSPVIKCGGMRCLSEYHRCWKDTEFKITEELVDQLILHGIHKWVEIPDMCLDCFVERCQKEVDSVMI